MSNVITVLEPEDLERSQRIDARAKAMVLLPAAFGAQAIEDHYMKTFAFNLEMTKKYGLPSDGDWYIDSDTGAVVRQD